MSDERDEVAAVRPYREMVEPWLAWLDEQEDGTSLAFDDGARRAFVGGWMARGRWSGGERGRPLVWCGPRPLLRAWGDGDPERLLVRLTDAAWLLSTSRKTVQELVRTGELETVVVERERLIPRGELERWIGSRRAEAGASRGDEGKP